MNITLSPQKRTLPATGEQTILKALRHHHANTLVSICGGRGICGKCRFRLRRGRLSPLTAKEKKLLSSQEITAGIRLACQAVPLNSVIIEPCGEERLTSPYKTSLALSTTGTKISPRISKKYLHLDLPTLADPRADLLRLTDSLGRSGTKVKDVAPNLLPRLPWILRKANWRITTVMAGSRLIGVEAGNTEKTMYGIGFDLGTTTAAAYLLDLTTGSIQTSAGETNRQAEFGEDVMTRIDRAHESSPVPLQAAALSSLNHLAQKLCEQAEISPARIYEAVVVGNTCMHHLLLGIDPYHLAVTPFTPALQSPVDLNASTPGLNIAPNGNVHLVPVISGFVGSDTVANIIAQNMDRVHRPHLLVDLGTNAEMVLALPGKMLACSAAAGPAFEGARILHGMRAGPGAIDRVSITEGKFSVRTIDNQLPRGIAGSGLISAAAALKRAGLINRRGSIAKAKLPPAMRARDGSGLLLVSASQSATSRPIILTWRDIGQELVMAKAAIRAGIEILLRESGLDPPDLQTVYIAGAFGNYLDINDALTINLFPNIDKARIKPIGNAAGKGAVMCLLSNAHRKRATRIPKKVKVIELSNYPNFNTIFRNHLML